MALPGLKNSISRHSVKKPSLNKAGGGSTRASGLKFKAAGAMTNTARASIFSSRHAGSRGNFVYASSSSKLAKYGLHINRNGKISNKLNFSGLRAALNAHSGSYSNNIRYVTPSYTTGNCSNCNGNSTNGIFSSIQQLMMMSQMLGLNRSNNNNTVKTETDTVKTVSNTPSSFSAITDSTSTDSINSTITYYNKISFNNNIAISEDSKKVLNEYGVSTDDLSGIPQQIDTDADFDTATSKINEDITKVTKFTTNAQNAQGKLSNDIAAKTQSITALETRIATIDAQINQAESLGDTGAETKTRLEEQKKELEEQKKELEEQKKELEEQKKELDTANKNLSSLISSGDSLIDNMQSSLEKLKNINTKQNQEKDQKYDLAKQHDDTLGSINKELNKLTKEQSKYTGKTDEKSMSKFKEITDKIQSLNTQKQSVTTDLQTGIASNDGQTTFTNSKGKSYTVKNLTTE